MKELIPGGLAEGMDCQTIADKHGVPVEDIEKQEKMGIKIEHEHTPKDDVAAEIARDHLSEFPYYYDFLEDMESEMKTDYKEKGYGKKQKDSRSPEEIADARKKEAIQRLFG
jgi:hypothetical protein